MTGTRRGQPLFGGWATLPSPLTIESLARSGVDFVVLDMQHGALDFTAAIAGLQLLDVMGVPSYLRLSDLELHMAPRYLDHGANGVIVATTRNADDARRALEVCRYQPEGIRSHGGQRFGLRSEPPHPRDVRPEVWMMVETLGGVEHLDEIASVPGIAGLLVGPADLALAFDVPPGQGEGHEGWSETIRRVPEVAHLNGIDAAIYAGTGRQARIWADAGYDRVIAASDMGALRGGLAREVADARRESAAGTIRTDV